MLGVPLTCAEAGAALRAGEVSSVELTREALRRADVLDAALGVYLARFDEAALAQAARADADFARGVDRGPLQGVPVGVKDNFATAEGPTTAQSLVLDPAWGAGRDSVVVERLRAAGAVITGKLTLQELAVGLPDHAKPFPVPSNPWDTGRWAGGSSSGSAVAVAAGLVAAAIGSDTGGSIRAPAAYCGVSGLMPTYGRVPTAGCVPVSASLDRAGPLAATARDCATVLTAIAGPDPRDPACAPDPLPDLAGALDGTLAGLRIGVERVQPFGPDDDPAARDLLDAAVAVLADLGAEVVEVRLPYFAETATAAGVTAYAEAFAQYRDELRERWDDLFVASRTLLAVGALISAPDYVQAQRVRRAAQRALDVVFAGVDLVVMPTSTRPAPTHAEMRDGAFDFPALLRAMHTPYWNATGHPVLAIPMGFTAGGLPMGLQIAGRPFDEATVLRAGDAYQRRTDWHGRVPPAASALLEAAA